MDPAGSTRPARLGLALGAVLAAVGCADPVPGADAGADAGFDAVADAGGDAGSVVDAGADAGPAPCGDGRCDPGEHCLACPADCAPCAPLEGDVVLGNGFDGIWGAYDYQTAEVRLEVRAVEVGAYFHIQATAAGPADVFVLRGTRVPGGMRESEGHRLLAAVNQPYVNPVVEFRAYAAGVHTLVFGTRSNSPHDWEAQFAAPRDLPLHYRIDRSPTSPARAQGRSVYLLEDTFPERFVVGGVPTAKSAFDFAAYATQMNAIFRKYSEFMGGDYTRYGTMVGVRYPADPAYPYLGDAASPINEAFFPPLDSVAEPVVFTHELAHVFTLGYPFVCSFAGSNNVEPAANYLRDWVADPRGGGGLSVSAYRTHEADRLGRLLGIGPATPWQEAVRNDGFLLLLKNASGGWDGIRSVLHGYSSRYAGSQLDRDGDERAAEFYSRLVASIPDAGMREAFSAQLVRWGVPWVPAAAQVDADTDGFVAGLDPDDADARTSPALPEFLEDGRDNNLDGATDDGVLRAGSEIIAMGESNAVGNSAASQVHVTRRRRLLAAGQTLRVQVASSHRIGITLFEGNAWEAGPLWWSGYPVVRKSTTTVNPSLEVAIPTTGVYTVDFQGTARDGVAYLEPITCTASVE